jgi:hypothetical protein
MDQAINNPVFIEAFTSILLVIQTGLGLGLAYSCFCRLTKTNDDVHKALRGVLVFTAMAALMLASAPFIWRVHPTVWNTLILLAFNAEKAVNAKSWIKGVPHEFYPAPHCAPIDVAKVIAATSLMAEADVALAEPLAEIGAPVAVTARAKQAIGKAVRAAKLSLKAKKTISHKHSHSDDAAAA